MIITIDGPSGTGKSTVAKKVAKQLQFTYVDTGSMFRSYAYGLLQQGISPDSKTDVINFIRSTPLTLSGTCCEKQFFLAECNVTPFLQSLDIAKTASQISTIPEVREILKELQRAYGKSHHAIFCGRDMGSVIFPQAELKIYLTADISVRAQRRLQDLQSSDTSITQEIVEKELTERDTRDCNRVIAPLRPAEDAHIIDTSSISVDEVVNMILVMWKNRIS